MLAAFVSPIVSTIVPQVNLPRPCGQPRKTFDTSLLAAGAPIVALGAAAAAARTRRGERRARVAAAAGWKPDPQRIGATLPLADPSDGVPMWDPAGFCKDGKQETFDSFREAEVKHGRVAMIAVVGLVTQHYLKFPAIVTPEGNIPLGDSAPSGIFAITQYPGSMGFGVLVLLAGFLELGVLKSPEGSKPWQFGDPFNWRKAVEPYEIDDDTLATYEIEHGRLAMLGFIGTITAEYVTGFDAVDQWANWKTGFDVMK